MTRRLLRCSLIVLALGALPALSNVAHAQQQEDNNARQSDINRSQAAERAKKEVNGRVLRVDKDKSKYRVKMLKKSGRVVSVDVDRRSGQVKQQQQTQKTQKER